MIFHDSNPQRLLGLFGSPTPYQWRFSLSLDPKGSQFDNIELAGKLGKVFENNF